MLAFSLSGLERDSLETAKLPPLFAYLGVALLFAAQFFAIDLSVGGWRVWPAITAALCAVLVLVAALLPGAALAWPYAQPLRLAGLSLMLVPLLGTLTLSSQPAVGALTFGVAGLTYLAEAGAPAELELVYAGCGALLAVVGWLLLFFHVSNPQAYAIPLGLWLLAAGWNERRRGQPAGYRWVTLLGLVILMGTAFYQSLGNVVYGVLLLAESLAAVAWGIRTRSRGYVQLGGLALIANAIAQLGPGFVDLPRWIQLGTIGTILLGGGLAALLRRETNPHRPPRARRRMGQLAGMNVFAALFGIFRQRGLVLSLRDGRPLAGFTVTASALSVFGALLYGFAMGIGLGPETAIQDALKLGLIVVLGLLFGLPIFWLAFRLWGAKSGPDRSRLSR